MPSYSYISYVLSFLYDQKKLTSFHFPTYISPCLDFSSGKVAFDFLAHVTACIRMNDIFSEIEYRVFTFCFQFFVLTLKETCSSFKRLILISFCHLYDFFSSWKEACFDNANVFHP